MVAHSLTGTTNFSTSRRVFEFHPPCVEQCLINDINSNRALCNEDLEVAVSSHIYTLTSSSQLSPSFQF